MNRIFEFNNKNEIELNVEGFDKAPILIGSEQSNGLVSIDNLSQFNNCNVLVKSINIKDENDDVIELKTYYTLAVAKDKVYNNDIISDFEKNEDSKIKVEVCLGFKKYKRYIILEYSAVENLVTITKTLSSKLTTMFATKNDKDNYSNEIKVVFYDEDGFETEEFISPTKIEDYILSVRIIDTVKNDVKDSTLIKAQKIFSLIKDNGKNSIESIANFSSAVMKMVLLKKA